MTDGQRKEILDSLQEYSHLVEDKIHENFSITDNREDAIQYALCISEDEYIYFEYDFEGNYIHEEHMRYEDMTKEDLAYAKGTFQFEEINYTEAERKQLTMELKFEAGLT